MDFINDIKHAFNRASIVEKLIYILVAMFLISVLLPTFALSWLSLPSNGTSFISKPWTILSYGFIHFRLIHFLSNIIVLYYAGNLFLDFYTKKQFINYYFLGVLVGGIAFLLNYYISDKTGGNLIGASAGVATIFVAIATKIPRYALRLRFIGSVELWVLAAIWVVLNILQISNVDNGSAIAHLSGAAFGFIYAKQMENGIDIGKWFESTINFFTNLLKKKDKTPLKTVYKSKKRASANDVTKSKQRKIDDILDKISKSGYESLSQEEKDFLFRAGK